jgi:hypothetical protein
MHVCESHVSLPDRRGNGNDRYDCPNDGERHDRSGSLPRDGNWNCHYSSEETGTNEKKRFESARRTRREPNQQHSGQAAYTE